MDINYNSWVYSANLNEKTLTFYIDEMSYEDMLKVMAEYVGFKLILRPKPVAFVINDDYKKMIRPKDLASQCPCNPANGGSGVCGCTMGGMWSTSCRHDG